MSFADNRRWHEATVMTLWRTLADGGELTPDPITVNVTHPWMEPNTWQRRTVRPTLAQLRMAARLHTTPWQQWPQCYRRHVM